ATTAAIWLRKRLARSRRVFCRATTQWSLALVRVPILSAWQSRVGTRRRNLPLGQLALARFQSFRRSSAGDHVRSATAHVHAQPFDAARFAGKTQGGTVRATSNGSRSSGLARRV